MNVRKKRYGLLVALLGFVFISSLGAEKIYQYRDKNGTLHFTNTPPNTDQPLEIWQVRVKGVEKRLRVDIRKSEMEHTLIVSNEYGGPVEVEFSIPESENIVTDPPMPVRLVVPAIREIEVIRIAPRNKKRSWSHRYRYSYCYGNPLAEHRPAKPYRPPFQRGQAFRISQAFGGHYSHNTVESKYALDIVMPEGTPICAARAGVVFDIADDFFTGGTNRKANMKRANYIRILHDDGTMAVYAHLQLESIRVGIGKKVSEGQRIAKSGNTGFSSGPHLHFAIQKNIGMQLVSIPFMLMDASGGPVVPKRDMVLNVY